MGKVRITLLSLLLLVAVVCLSVSHWNTSRQLAKAHAELTRMRDEVGYLSVEDETKVHVLAIDGEPGTWQWRMWVPKGARYKWNIACEDIVLNTPTPYPMTGVSNQPYWEKGNHVLVTARLVDSGDGNCVLSVTSKIGDSVNQMAGAQLTFPEEKKPLAVSMQHLVLGSSGTELLEPGDPVFLLQHRVFPEDPATGVVENDRATPGYMVWMSKW